MPQHVRRLLDWTDWRIFVLIGVGDATAAGVGASGTRVTHIVQYSR